MLTIERCCRECVADLKRSISVGTASRRRRRSCCHRSNARDRRLDCQRRASCSAFGSSISQASPKGNSDKPLRHDRGTRGPANSLYIYILKKTTNQKHCHLEIGYAGLLSFPSNCLQIPKFLTSPIPPPSQGKRRLHCIHVNYRMVRQYWQEEQHWGRWAKH